MAAWEMCSHLRPLLRAAGFPQLEMRFNHRINRFELVEHVTRGAVKDERVIWEYENVDGSQGPVVLSHLIEHIHLSDTRKFPMKERLKQMREAKKKDEDSMWRRFRDEVGSRAIENFKHVSGTPTFFFGKNMEVPRITYTDAQRRILKSQGLL